MRPFLIVLFLFLGGKCSAQLLYRATYTDSLNFAPDSAMEASVRKAEGFDRLPDEMKEQMLQEVLKRITNRVVEINVQVYADSSSIEMQDNGDDGLHMNIRNARKTWRKGQVFVAGTPGQQLSGKDGADVSYKATGRGKQLLGYECIEYQSSDGLTFIWAAPRLPPGITPGLLTPGIKGAVLEFISRNKSKQGFSHGIITRLEAAP